MEQFEALEQLRAPVGMATNRLSPIWLRRRGRYPGRSGQKFEHC